MIVGGKDREADLRGGTLEVPLDILAARWSEYVKWSMGVRGEHVICGL